MHSELSYKPANKDGKNNDNKKSPKKTMIIKKGAKSILDLLIFNFDLKYEIRYLTPCNG